MAPCEVVSGDSPSIKRKLDSECDGYEIEDEEEKGTSDEEITDYGSGEEEDSEMKKEKSDDGKNSDSDYESKEQAEECRKYLKYIIKSEGFSVPDVIPRGHGLFGVIYPIDLKWDRPYLIERAHESAKLAVNYYNTNMRKEGEEELKFVEIVKVNRRCADEFYITLKARSLSSPLKINTYQTEVFYRCIAGNLDYKVKLFRQKKN